MISSIDTSHLELFDRIPGGWRMISWCSWDQGKSVFHPGQIGFTWQSIPGTQPFGYPLELIRTL